MSTSEKEIIGLLEQADEKLKLRIRETVGTVSMYKTTVVANRESLAQVRMYITRAINQLLLIEWE